MSIYVYKRRNRKYIIDDIEIIKKVIEYLAYTPQYTYGYEYNLAAVFGKLFGRNNWSGHLVNATKYILQLLGIHVYRNNGGKTRIILTKQDQEKLKKYLKLIGETN